MKVCIQLITMFCCIQLNTGCSTVLPEMDSDINYQRDIEFHVEYWDLKKKSWSEKQQFVGTAVIKWAKKYRVTLFAPGKVDMMVLYSCHRELKTPHPKKSGGWFSEKKYKFEFTADELIEKNKMCMLNAGVYEKKKGRHGWGMMALAHSTATVKAVTRCNGKVDHNKNTPGTSFCQAKEGLVQMIQFEKPMFTTMYGDCVIKTPEDGKNWEYLMPGGKCILNFMDIDFNEHVHYMFGYDTIPLRGVQ